MAGVDGTDAWGNQTIDFGFYQLNLGNQVWFDQNGDGLLNGVEAGLNGITVTLYQNGSVVSETVTSGNGVYNFTNLVSGVYTVSIVAPPTYISSVPTVTDVNGNVDGDYNGLGYGAGVISSGPITLTPGSEPSVLTATGTTTNTTLDFGLVHVRGSSRSITRTRGVLGTPGYMAPEQARGDEEEGQEVDGRADLFSLGAVLFECLTGRRAFEGVHMIALLAQLLLADVPRVKETLPGVPEALDDLVARMLAKDPSDRPEGAAVVERALAALGAGPVPARLSLAPAPGPAITGDEQRLIAVIAIAHDRSAGVVAEVRASEPLG